MKRAVSLLRSLGPLACLGLLHCGQVPPCQSVAAPPPPPLVVVAPSRPSEASAPQAPATPSSEVATAQPNVPYAITRRQNYRIEFAPYAFEIDPTGGAVILEFSLNGRSIIVPAKESPSAYGSSIWSSPQSDWGWPPPPELDALPWSAKIEGSALVLESGVSQALGLQVRQRIQAEPGTQSLLIDYEFINRGKASRKISPWQNTRVRPFGLTFYPASRPSYDYPENTLTIAPVSGISWFHHEPAAIGKDSKKSFADGEEGWMAHLDDRLLFIKQFEPSAVSEQAPKEGEVVLYVDGRAKFVEMEQQGSFAEIAPGASRHWKVRWVLRQLPDGMKAEKGNAKLVKFVRDTLRPLSL